MYACLSAWELEKIKTDCPLLSISPSCENLMNLFVYFAPLEIIIKKVWIVRSKEISISHITEVSNIVIYFVYKIAEQERLMVNVEYNYYTVLSVTAV